MQFSAVEFYVTVRCAFPSERNFLCVLNFCCKKSQFVLCCNKLYCLECEKKQTIFLSINISLLFLSCYNSKLLNVEQVKFRIDVRSTCSLNFFADINLYYCFPSIVYFEVDNLKRIFSSFVLIKSLQTFKETRKN